MAKTRAPRQKTESIACVENVLTDASVRIPCLYANVRRTDFCCKNYAGVRFPRILVFYPECACVLKLVGTHCFLPLSSFENDPTEDSFPIQNFVLVILTPETVVSKVRFGRTEKNCFQSVVCSVLQFSREKPLFLPQCQIGRTVCREISCVVL